MGKREDETPLLEDGLSQDQGDAVHTGDGSVDVKGKPALKSTTGKWKACPFILGTECCERLAFYGIATNLVTYLTGKLHEGNVAAAVSVSTWSGTCYLTPLLGAVLADAYWGRYWTIAVFSTIYFIGMCTLTLSATVPGLMPSDCVDSVCPSATATQYAVLFIGLYLIALGTGGIKPCVSSFGADQFDDTDSKEKVNKGSFFNWFYFSINIGALVSSSLIVWIQENVGWGWGFAIPALFMGIAIGSFFSGTPIYRFQKPGGSPITRMCQVVAASFRKCNVNLPEDSSLLYETQEKNSAIAGSRKLVHSNQFKCLDKAAVVTVSDINSGDFSNGWKICTVTQVEELKILLRMFPIWATGIVFSAVYSQMSTMFVEQGEMMDTTIGSFTIPAASLSTFDVISVIFWVPVYDKLIIPIARKFTGNEKGFSELQRMGIGLFISILSMVVAALVEIRRLQLAKEYGLVDEDVAVPMSILWQIPQYFLIGASEIFTFIGQLQFFYEQSPDAMRSLCSALSLLTTSLGGYLSSFILTVVTAITTRGGSAGWIPDNLNEGHLDYFFWLLAGLSFVNLGIYVICAQRLGRSESTREGGAALRRSGRKPQQRYKLSVRTKGKNNGSPGIVEEDDSDPGRDGGRQGTDPVQGSVCPPAHSPQQVPPVRVLSPLEVRGRASLLREVRVRARHGKDAPDAEDQGGRGQEQGPSAERGCGSSHHQACQCLIDWRLFLKGEEEAEAGFVVWGRGGGGASLAISLSCN